MKGQFSHYSDTLLVAQLQAEVSEFGAQCVQHGLKSTAQQCARFVERLGWSKYPVTCGYAREELSALRKRFEDDLKVGKFFHLSIAEAELFDHPTKEWEKATERSPKIRHDVEESAKCFSFGRYAASLFHVLLVAEFGVIEVSKLFNAEGDKPGWGTLDRLQAIHAKKWADKTDIEKQHSGFLGDLLPLAIAIKDSWRHKISHVDNKLEWMDTDFSPEVTSEIISVTRGFMRRLAKDLPK